jgi:glycosyltransferase involved in cell wall biosynthesis
MTQTPASGKQSTQKTILLLNMSFAYDWDRGIVNRNYHILQQAIRSHRWEKIISVDFFPFTFKKKIKFLLRDKPWKKTPQTIANGLTWTIERSVAHESVIRVRALSITQLPKIAERLGIDVSSDADSLTVWSYNPLATEVYEQFPNATQVFDAVDNWLEHGSYSREQERLKDGYEMIRQYATVIFTVSQTMVDFFGKREHVVYIPNGVDVDFFSSGTCAHPALMGLKGPVIGYHGNIQSRINFTLLEYLITKHTDYQFVLAGFVWKEVSAQIAALEKRSNVTIIREIPYSQLPNIIACFDVAIIPHVIDRFTQSMNPLKLYEYLAAGKPVIATAVAGVEQFGDLVTLAISPEDFSKGIEDAIQNESVEMMERRMHAVDSHRWEDRWRLMTEVLERNFSKENI